MKRLLLSAALFPALAFAQSSSWNIDSSGNWSTPANWQSSQVATGAPSTATFTRSISTDRTITVDSSPWDIGTLVFASSSFNWIVDGGTLNACSNFVINQGTATVNSVILNSSNIVKSGSGKLVFSGNCATNSYLGINDGTLEFAGTSSLATTNISVSDNTNATLNITDNASISVSTWFLLGNPAGFTGTVNQTGGTVTYSGSAENFRIGHWANETSSYILSGGTLTATNDGLRIGYDGTGIMTVNGGSLTAGNILLGRNNVASTLNLNGGTANIGFLSVSPGGTSGNRINISGTAIVNVTSLHIGQISGQSGIVNQAGGTVTVSGNLRVGHYPNETSTYTMNSGSLIMSGIPSQNPYQTGGSTPETSGAIYLGIDGTGIFNQNGGTVTTPGLVLDNRGDTAGTDTYTLNGGILTLGTWGIQGNPSSALNFGGGTVGASASWSTAKPITLTATNGNVTFNPGTNTITLSGILSGTGGLTKAGSGTLNLTATNTYSGSTTLSNGIIVLASGGSISNSTALFLAGGAVLDATAAGTLYMPPGATLGGSGTVSGDVSMADSPRLSPGDTNTTGKLTIAGNLTISQGMVYNWNFDGTTGDLVRVNGNVTVPAVATVNVSSTSGPIPLRIPLFSYGTNCNITDFSGWKVNGASGRLCNDTGLRQIYLAGGLVILVK